MGNMGWDGNGMALFSLICDYIGKFVALMVVLLPLFLTAVIFDGWLLN